MMDFRTGWDFSAVFDVFEKRRFVQGLYSIVEVVFFDEFDELAGFVNLANCRTECRNVQILKSPSLGFLQFLDFNGFP